jgi:hypothetical protein
MPLSGGCFEGPLNKWTNLIQGWQFRWFVLDQQNAILAYYTSKENISKGERRGCIRLKDAHVGYDNEDDITFTITVHDKTFHLQARNLDEREKWVSKIEKTIRLHSSSSNKLSLSANSHRYVINEQNTDNFDGSSKKSYHAKKLSKYSTSSTGDSNMNEFAKLSRLGIEKFDSSLAESDAYMQLLIEQLKV